MSSADRIKRIPERIFPRSSPISRHPDRRYKGWVRPAIVRERLGVRRYNNITLEVISGGHALKHTNVSGMGFYFLVGIAASVMMLLHGIRTITLEDWYFAIAAPFVLVACLGVVYVLFRRNRGSYIRLNRQTRKVYYIFSDGHSVALDWDELQPLAGHLDIGTIQHSIHYYPLLLLGVDWTQSPPVELFITCGNSGCTGSSEPAYKLWLYMQHFMNHGPEGLPASPPLLPKISRSQCFLDGYRKWGDKFRKDMSTPKGKRWAVLWVPAKVLWLIWIVFPMSIEAYLDHTLPEMQFCEEMDALCGFGPSSGGSSHR